MGPGPAARHLLASVTATIISSSKPSSSSPTAHRLRLPKRLALQKRPALHHPFCASAIKTSGGGGGSYIVGLGVTKPCADRAEMFDVNDKRLGDGRRVTGAGRHDGRLVSEQVPVIHVRYALKRSRAQRSRFVWQCFFMNEVPLNLFLTGLQLKKVTSRKVK
ncbi:hypothetical protein BJV74DRAFT_414300 [Russula compacta]|nr:hypothetical protein BJV74DRAFT_414300 [Russula compacta]